MEYPIFTFSSGSTNSMRGAMHLSGISDAIVIDIGGTTTDVGVLVNGFPREASSQVKVLIDRCNNFVITFIFRWAVCVQTLECQM